MAYKDIDKRNKWFRERYRKNMEFVQQYKLQKGCADCGYSTHHAGLEFDHVNGILRDRVASLVGRSMKVLLQEIEKCDVVCGTCHGIRTWNRAHAAIV